MPSLRIPHAEDVSTNRWESAIRDALDPQFFGLIESAEFPGLGEEPMGGPLADYLHQHQGRDLLKDPQNSTANPGEVESAAWLLCGELDRSHDISQDLHSPWGSFLHGIMHRREGDYSNAQYWFRRAGCREIESILEDMHAGEYMGAHDFVKRCRSACESSACEDQGKESDSLISAQWSEWTVLMGFIVGESRESR